MSKRTGENEMKIAVVYYSETNNTKAAADYVAAKTGAKLVRVQGKRNTNPMKSVMRAATRPVGNPWEEIADCDRIILMTPIYAFNGIPVVRGFLQAANLKGKQVVLITNGADGGTKFADKVVAQFTPLIEKAGGKVSATFHHLGGEYKKFAGEQALQERLDVFMDEILAAVTAA
jgi:flavodoxin